MSNKTDYIDPSLMEEEKREKKETKFSKFSPDNPNIKITAIVIAVIATVALATYATGKFLGVNALDSGWCWIVFGALAVIFLINWIEKNIQIESAKTVCKAVVVISLSMLIVWTVWPDKTVKKIVDEIRKKPKSLISKQIMYPFQFNKGEKVSTVSVPNKSNVQFNSNKAFYIVERYGLNDDGSEKLTKIKMPSGDSKRYFVWGGTVRAQGMYDNTKLTVLY